ncbi:MAG: hypothetical protein AAGA30_15590, partial [Planctomycetota bacterium]
FFGHTLPSTQADVVITFSVDGGMTFGSFFDVNTGTSTEVGIYLAETSPDDVLSNDGLFGFGLSLQLATANTGEISAGTIDNVFDFVATDVVASEFVRFEAATFFNQPPTGSVIQLAEFEFTPIADGSSIFMLEDISPGIGTVNTSWLSGIGNELDHEIFGTSASGTFPLTLSATTAIPEPFLATPVTFGCVVCLIATRRRNDTAIV